jgi:hypothetical protein
MWRWLMSPMTSSGSPSRGRDAVADSFHAIASHVSISETEVVGLAAEDSDVVATVRWTYTVNATGKTASMSMRARDRRRMARRVAA